MTGDDSLLDLYAPDDMVAKARADAMIQHARGLQGAGLVLSALTGKRDPTGGALGEMGARDLATATQAVQHRPAMLLQGAQARRATEEEDAWKRPEAGQMLRGALSAFMPNLQVDEGTPTPVLRNLLPVAEKFGQSYNALALRQMAQDKYMRKTDPLTKRIYVEHPLTGESFWENGEQRSPPLRQGVPRLGAPVPAAPAATPGAAPAQAASAPAPKTPRLRTPGAPTGGAPKLEPWDTRHDKLSEAFKKDMDAAAGSSRNVFGEAARVIFRGARNLALLDQRNPDGSQRQLTEPEWQEVAGGLVAMQTGGVPTQEMMRHAMPKDLQGDMARFLSWLKSAPEAPDRQEWIQRFRDNIAREEEVANKTIRETQLKRLPSHSMYFSLYPNRAKLAAKGYGVEPELIDQVVKGTYAPPTAEAAPAKTAVPNTEPLKFKDEADLKARYASIPRGAMYLVPGETKPRRKR